MSNKSFGGVEEFGLAAMEPGESYDGTIIDGMCDIFGINEEALIQAAVRTREKFNAINENERRAGILSREIFIGATALR